MTELKTLKDLPRLSYAEIEENKHGISEDMLKAEAVKWVKHYLKVGRLEIIRIIRNNDGLVIEWRGDSHYYAGLIYGIIDFNDITEEDLKEKTK
jgi:hypothetical protein